MSQSKFTKELLQEAGITKPKPTFTPLPLNIVINLDEGELYYDFSTCSCLVGKLNFLTHTRADLAFTIQYLSQFLQNSRVPHFQALVHTLNYVANTAGQDIVLQYADSLTL